MKDNMKWLCDNAQLLEKFSGRWIIFNSHQGVVSANSSLPKALKSCPKTTETEKPSVFHVPSKRELDRPVMVPRKK